jgi:hypothetical protein
MEFLRDIVYQPFDPIAITVLTTPTPILAKSSKSDLIDSFIVSVPASALNNVFVGNNSVTLTTGLEIVAGAGPAEFKILNQRVQYDIHSLMEPVIASLPCNVVSIKGIPFIIWDLTQICLIAVANTAIVVLPIRSQFV